ncbi:MAG: hypothetical protein K4571_04355 [Deltaproteobacteria bacterium]
MKKTLWIIGIFLMLCWCAAGCSSQSNSNLVLIRTYEGGALYKAGSVNVLSLKGTHYQMGRQYGMLMKDEMNALLALAVSKYSVWLSEARMLQVANAYYANFPQKYRDVIAGMAETSGLGLDRQIVVNGIEIIQKINSIVPAAHCTGLVVWGDYTGGAPLIFGRSNDDHPFFRNFGGYVVVAVFNPTDGGIPTAVINYAGAIYAPTALNRYGIFMEINSGNSPGGFKLDRKPTVVSMFEFLQSCQTLAQVNEAFQTMQADISSIVNVSDLHGVYSFECSLDAMKRASVDPEGLLVSTNHFLDPSWGLSPPTPDQDAANGWTVARRTNGLAWAEAHRGQATVERMMAIMSKEIVTEKGLYNSTSTIFQVVAVPAALTIWLRAPDHFEWQKIELGGLFYN